MTAKIRLIDGHYYTQWHKNGDHPHDEYCPKPLFIGGYSDPEGKVVSRWTQVIDVPCRYCEHSLDDHGRIFVDGIIRVCPGDYVSVNKIDGEYQLYRKNQKPDCCSYHNNHVNLSLLHIHNICKVCGKDIEYDLNTL